MKTLTRDLILPAAAFAALLLAPTAGAATRVAVGVRLGPVAVVHAAAPYRGVGGIRIYAVSPGRGWVKVQEGWVLPPHARAVWVPGHYNRRGVFVPGHWRT